ncbi:MAG: molybdopterin cofactor-binding domain-containing protein [Woeseiaceae bacterium]
MGKWTRRAFITTGVLAGGTLAIGVAIRPGDRRSRIADLIAGEEESVLNIWVKISPDNTITAIVPHADMGQGVHTTLAMMLADEMDADWSTMDVLEAPSHEEYANYALARGYALGEQDFPSFLIDTVDGFFLEASQFMGLQITGGSSSVRATGMVGMRVAGAAARSVLKQAAADSWQVPIDELTTRNSHIHHAPSKRSATYATFAARAAALSVPPKPRLKTEEEFSIMGRSVPRLDIPAKVDGTASFGIDAVLPGMKYAAVKAAPVFGDRIKSADTASVQDMPGVRKVVKLDDAIAIVADGYWQAQQAVDRIAVEYESSGNANIEQSDIFKQFAANMDRAVENDDQQIDVKTGDAQAAMSAAGKIVEAEYRVPYLAHATMEPMNCTAWVHDGECELWTGTQNPLAFAMEVAEAIDMDASNVTVHNQYLGGGFGRRAFSDYAIQAARVASQVPYPVKLIWSREEDMRHDHYRDANISRFRAALDDSGRPTAWINQFVEKHDPAEAPHIPYGIENQFVHFAESKTHVPWGFWRSVDHSLHGFFTESFIDELAIAASKDPYQFRHDLLADAPKHRAVLDLAAEKAGWGEPLPDNWGRGIALQKSFGSIVAQVVEVEVKNGKPRAHRVVCAIDAGYAFHPDGIRAQMESGIIYGLTAALYGEISIHRGSVAQSNFHDYQMLRMNESPDIETYIINSGDAIGGAGEPGTPAIAPALANAIYDAVGIRIRELPIVNHDLRIEDLESRDVA